jgi:hypothetical protein
MSRSITRINKTHSIEKVLNGEKKFYAEYNSKVIIVNDEPKRVPALHIDWDDRRSITDRLNNTPHFYYVALRWQYEGDYEEKYFLNKDKAEEYAHHLYESRKADIEGEDAYMDLITDVLPFND